MADRYEPQEPLTDADGRTVPPQARLGLLNYVTATSLDADYAQVSEKHRADGAAPTDDRRRRGRHLPTLVALAVFGVLVTTAGIQTAREEPIRQSSRESLVAQVQDRRAELADAREQIDQLERTVEEVRGNLLETSAEGRALRDQLARLALATGAEPGTGPGVRITVDDSAQAESDRQVVLDTDLQLLANGLWLSGAEAIAINGQRLTNLSAIRVAGEAITVNLQSLSRPYVVDAIGDPDQIAARFVETDAGSWWLNLKAVYDLQFSMTTEESLTVPAAPPLSLRHARRPGAGR
jgi:uncharacterized protein YlxW (UPF0749 family)